MGGTYLRWRRVLLVSGVVFVVAATFGVGVTGVLKGRQQDFQAPGSQYERVNAAIRRATGQEPYWGVVALLAGPREIRGDAGAERGVAHVAALLARRRGFQRVLDYPATRSAELLSRDGRQTLVLAAFATPEDSVAAVARVRAALARPAGRAALAGMSVSFGGSDVLFHELTTRTISGLGRAGRLAFPILLLLLLWVFRGLVAALLPLLVGGFAIVLAFLTLRLLDPFVGLSVLSLNVVSGLGLGLGIDYSLFVLSRYREELAGGAETAGAIARTLGTAGRTVLFSSLTVAASLASLVVFPVRVLYTIGIGGAVVALFAGAVALIVLPAVLMALGPRIDGLSPGFLRRRSARAGTGDAWSSFARGVMRHPGAIALVTGGALLAVAAPALRLQLVAPSAALLPSSAPSHRVEAAAARDFAVNSALTIEIVTHAPAAPVPAPAHAAAAASSRVAAVPVSVSRLAAAAAGAAGSRVIYSPPRYLGRAAWEIDLLPRGSPFSSADQRLVKRLRGIAHGYGALVGGAAAYFIDQKATIASGIPFAVAIVMLLSGGFLFLMTGSVVLPLKALLMNLLTVSVAAGLLVLIFQDGHLSSLLGFTPIGGLEETNLVLLFVLVIALSTDYEIFLLARIKEAHDTGLGDRDAVALGLERTGRLITAAALLFCVAVGSFVTSEIFFIKQFGVGTALAVAIDASVVRALLVPSLMALLGPWNWWAPRPLRALYLRVGLRE